MSPIDVETLARRGFHAHVRPVLHGVLAHSLQVVLEDRDAAVIAERLQPLE